MTLDIFDADRHVMEPLDLWAQYLDPEIYRTYPIKVVQDNQLTRQDRVERLGRRGDLSLPPVFVVGDLPLLNNWSEDIQIASAMQDKGNRSARIAAMHPDSQLASMDDSSISVAYLFSTFAGYVVNHEGLPAEVSLAYADAYNRWLKDYCSVNPERLKAVGLLSRHEPTTLCCQLNQIIENGWRSICLRPEVINGKDFGYPEYIDFWAKCEKHNISVVFHGGTNLNAPTAGSHRFQSRFAMHACSHPMEAQMAFVSLLESGVFERHPKLKFAFLEAGASWVPHWLWRLDNICYPEFPSLVEENIKLLPSEYFKRQCWVAVELGEPCLREVIETVGSEKLLYGSDFPHPDHMHFTTEDIANQLGDFSEAELKNVLVNNAKTFFGFDG
ncbi:amidohydrolase family protein [Litoribrevibacter albus]|uniref:Amidohydrolase n=1 Tax=Litoribrevibacter albus TaxID=1473156 RepID=A0AA37S7Z0_9GAMM|nr:amidohydrolase family protein [Litoribrevibacter albus]GLQ30870.1 amidohydrolase [Litoribrevibacter albus]